MTAVLDETDAVQIKARRRLGKEIVAWLTTVSPSGQPQSSPVWYLWRDNRVTLLTEPTAGKVRNVRHNSRVSLHLNTDQNGGGIVTIDGTAEYVPRLPHQELLSEYLEKYRDDVTRLGFSTDQLLQIFSHHVVVTPVRIRVY